MLIEGKGHEIPKDSMPISKTVAAGKQFIYMGKLDDNDAVQFTDAYNDNERKIMNENIGNKVQERYLDCQKIYLNNNIHTIFKTYENVGH